MKTLESLNNDLFKKEILLTNLSSIRGGGGQEGTNVMSDYCWTSVWIRNENGVLVDKGHYDDCKN